MNFESLAKFETVVTRPLPPEKIEERTQGGVTLSYIGGDYVTELLNEACGYKWDFSVLQHIIVPSEPKALFVYENKVRKPVLNPDGSQKTEPQPPVLHVLGRLNIDGLGHKEQWGSKILIGGATEQESAFKSATTDAMKKCASMFGFGLELYGKKTNKNSQGNKKPQYDNKPKSIPAQQQAAKPQYNPADIVRLKEIKAAKGIVDNSELDSSVQEWLKDSKATYNNITPQNIAQFNKWMTENKM